MTIDANILSQINEEVLSEVDSNPSIGMDTTINNAEQVFDNKTVFERLDKIRQEITSQSSSTTSYGLRTQSYSAPVTGQTTQQQSQSSQTKTQTTPQSSGYGYGYGYSQKQEVKTKTREEKMNEYVNEISIAAKKQIESVLEKEAMTITKRDDNWTIFDLHEKGLKNKQNSNKQVEHKKEDSIKKEKFKVSFYDTLVSTGKRILINSLTSKDRR